jgi:hypothetical protein
MIESDAKLLEQIKADASAPPPADKLEVIRDRIRYVRDLELEIAELEVRTKELGRQRKELTFDLLPTMFMELGINSLGIDRQGNLPAYDAKLNDYYHAVIQSNWPPTRRMMALQWIRKHNLADIIKTTVTIELGLGQSKLLKKLMTALKKLHIMPKIEESIPWSTLTATVKERYQRGNPMSDKELDTIGATVTKVVKITPVREK